MRQKKYTLRPLELWDPCAVERWLEDEAARGWRLTDCGPRLAKLERREPAVCRVRIQPCGPESREAWQARFAAYEAMGWVFAATVTMDFEVFYCDDPAAPELQTDPVAWGWAWEKPLRRARWEGWLCLALAAALLLMPFMGGTPLAFFLTMPFLWLIAYPCGILLTVAYGVRALLAVRRTRRVLAAGMAPEFKGDWRKRYRWWRLFAALIVICWLVIVPGRIITPLQRPDAALPMMGVGKLAPDSSLEDWSLDLASYSRRSGFLRPAHQVIELYDQDQRRIENAGDRLRFAALSGPLYRERLAGFRREFPGLTETAVVDSRFDEAVLLADGEIQIFLARRENAVYALTVNFPVDLSARLDDLAALLADMGEEELT